MSRQYDEKASCIGNFSALQVIFTYFKQHVSLLVETQNRIAMPGMEANSEARESAGVEKVVFRGNHVNFYRL